MLLGRAWILSLFGLYLSSMMATSVAVIDTGVDYNHKFLAPYLWEHPKESLIGDENYIEDLHGWNFVDGNAQVISTDFQSLYSEDVRKFFELQSKIYLGTVVEEELTFLEEKMKDSDFMNSVERYANYSHGTHVAGISVKDSAKNRVLSLNIISVQQDQERGNRQSQAEKMAATIELAFAKGYVEDMVMLITLKLSAIDHGKEFIPFATYLKNHAVEVANGSYGTSFENILPLVASLYRTIYGADTEIDKNKFIQFAFFYMNSIVEEGAKSLKQSPSTLFVFAAGNDGTNNDQIPVAPANIKTDNSITVAATIDRSALASFSNRGKMMVDVAAPGVSILSCSPGDQYIMMSGTSQAAPYVTNVAAEILNINSKLTPKEVKEILMQTVDKKEFLKDLVASEGIVNKPRALKAAFYSLTLSLDKALDKAKTEVSDIANLKKRFSPTLIDRYIWAASLPNPIMSL